jgi:hypothetical protein
MASSLPVLPFQVARSSPTPSWKTMYLPSGVKAGHE